VDGESVRTVMMVFYDRKKRTKMIRSMPAIMDSRALALARPVSLSSSLLFRPLSHDLLLNLPTNTLQHFTGTTELKSSSLNTLFILFALVLAMQGVNKPLHKCLALGKQWVGNLMHLRSVVEALPSASSTQPRPAHLREFPQAKADPSAPQDR
jgi:hypothetical protein